ncbi:MAG: hypothetical protein LBE09_02170, partial [Christensenellaceae bacterium]|nr:hypothetical protein [Christensenellaceae bacterium]
INGIINHCHNYGNITYDNIKLSDETNLLPKIAQIVGNNLGATLSCNAWSGSVSQGTLYTFKYGGFLGIGQSTCNQAKYVSSGEVGKSG